MARILLAVLFIAAGAMHFLFPAPYLRIMPPALPGPKLLLWVSGAAEIAGGMGLLAARTRNAAAWGLLLLLIAVWPANFYMASAHISFPGVAGQSWAQWLRVPLQIPLIVWALGYTQWGEAYRKRS